MVGAERRTPGEGTFLQPYLPGEKGYALRSQSEVDEDGSISLSPGDKLRRYLICVEEEA